MRNSPVLPGLALALGVSAVAVGWAGINGWLIEQDFLVDILNPQPSAAGLGMLGLLLARPVLVVSAPSLVVFGLVHAVLSQLGRKRGDHSS